MSKEEDKKLGGKLPEFTKEQIMDLFQTKYAGMLLKEANEILKKTPDQANYIHISATLIQQRAYEEGVTFDEMLKIIDEELKPPKDE